ncbi:NUMOD4 domain-containing protein [Pararhizobium qamdonense]|uniref:NUMOD4 domain-containing protein n=1 Tax=Pararhizobium qamdonense TaxID=3031126 RepID=UPI0038B286F1
MAEWRDIPGYEGYYRVSEEGHVKSCSRVIMRSTGAPQTVRERILRPAPGTDEYPSVSLSIDGKLQSRRVHLLVAEAFLGPAPANQEVRHRDGDRSNPRLDNLLHGTRVENMEDAREHGTLGIGERNGNSKLTDEQRDQIQSRVKAGGNQRLIAAEFGISQSRVSHIVHNWRSV